RSDPGRRGRHPVAGADNLLLPASSAQRPANPPPRPRMPVPATLPSSAKDASTLIERVIAQVPQARVGAMPNPAEAAERIAREAARNAALVSASLALPPGPLGMLTVLPDLYLIWKIQRQLVADIFAIHGRTP